MGTGDGHLHYRDDIALAQVVLFSIPFFFGFYFRWTRRICWFTLGGFSLIRCIGAGCMLGTVNRDSKGLWAGVFVCEGLGVLLLVFTLFEIMETIDKASHVVHKRVFWIPQVLTYIDIGISIAGFVTVSKKEHSQLLPTTWSRASIAILLLIYLYTVGVWVYFWMQRRQYDAKNYTLAAFVGMGLPFLFVRILYSVIFIVTSDMAWNAVKGNPTAYLLMTMLPELAFVAICCCAVARTPPGSQNQQPAKYQLQGEYHSWPGQRR